MCIHNYCVQATIYCYKWQNWHNEEFIMTLFPFSDLFQNLNNMNSLPVMPSGCHYWKIIVRILTWVIWFIKLSTFRSLDEVHIFKKDMNTLLSIVITESEKGSTLECFHATRIAFSSSQQKGTVTQNYINISFIRSDLQQRKRCTFAITGNDLGCSATESGE
jgi:hypothetical protein